MAETNNNQIDKSEILFLYESSFSVPNGDPFTGEQRYDEETKKALVSDVRIKRFIRDYLHEKGRDVYVIDPKDSTNKEQTGAGTRFKQLQSLERFKHLKNPLEILLQCIDARLFGGIVTIKDDKKKPKKDEATEGDEKSEKAFNVTGPVQFALLNPSLNKIDLRMHQNTSVFPSGKGKERGAISTSTVVPYSLNQIHGWINPYSAKHTQLTQDDISEMFEALWNSINNANTRTKSNQNSLLLLQIVYAEPMKKLYGLDRLINLVSEKQDEQIRNGDDYTLDLSKLKDAVQKDTVAKVNFYTERDDLANELKSSPKFEQMQAL